MHQQWNVSPSCVPGAFLLELLPSEVAGVDVGHVAEVISSHWYSSVSPWQRSSSSACQHLSQKMAPWTYIHVAYSPCPPPAFLTTTPTVPHWNTALCSQFQLPQCRGCSGLLLLLAVVLVGHCDPCAEETRCLEQRLQPPSPSHGTLGAAGTPGQAVPACWHPCVLKPPPALTQTTSFRAPDQTGFQCGTPGTTDNGGEQTRGVFPTEVPGNESGPTTRGEGGERDTLHSSQRSRGASWDGFPYVLYPLCYRLYLQHHHTDLFDTLDNRVGCPRDCHRPLRGVGQHVPRHLDLSTCGLETERERKEKSHS